MAKLSGQANIDNDLLDRTKTKDLISRGLDPNTRGITGSPIIFIWVARRDEELVFHLLDAGARTDLLDDGNGTLLQAAVRSGLQRVVTRLLQLGVDPNLTFEMSMPTPLFLAASDGDVDLVSTLLEYGADVDMRSYGSETPLMTAAEYTHFDVVQILVKAGANVNSRSSSGWTPLHHAAMNRGHLSIVHFLIASGADATARDADGYNATDHCRNRFGPVAAEGLRSLGIPDLYSVDESRIVDWQPRQDFDAFISYRQRHFSADADMLLKELNDLKKSVFVDRHEVLVEENVAKEDDEIIKVKLRRAVMASRLLIFFEMHQEAREINWQLFEVLHSSKAVLVSTATKSWSSLFVCPGEGLTDADAQLFVNYRDLAQQLVSQFLDRDQA